MDASDQSQYDRIEQDRRKREAELATLLMLLLARVQRKAAMAIRTGTPIETAITQSLSHATQPIAKAMAEAHVNGAARMFQMVDAKPPTAQMKAIAEHYQPAAEQYVQTIDKAIRAAVQTNQALATSKSLAAINGSLKDVFDTAGLGPANVKRLSDIASDAVLTADSEGTEEAAADPNVQKKTTAFRHVSVLTKTTTPICRARHGITLPPDAPYWRKNWPALHHGCRSIVIPLTSDDVTFKGPPNILPEPAAGFGYAPWLSGLMKGPTAA
jgi:SPP1 gp7 family putative phage head morphogenesis protein